MVKDEIHVANDGCGVCLGLDVGGIEAFDTGVELAEDVLHGFTFATVAFVDLGLYEVVWGDDDDDFAVEGKAEILYGLRVERIDKSEVKSLFIEVHW